MGERKSTVFNEFSSNFVTKYFDLAAYVRLHFEQKIKNYRIYRDVLRFTIVISYQDRRRGRGYGRENERYFPWRWKLEAFLFSLFRLKNHCVFNDIFIIYGTRFIHLKTIVLAACEAYVINSGCCFAAARGSLFWFFLEFPFP